MKSLRQLALLDKIFLVVLLIVFGGIVVHAPFSVGFGSLLPPVELLFKAWKEILLLAAVVLVGVILYRRRQLKLLKDPLLLIIAGYGLLHLILLPFLWTNGLATIAGLMIDLRYLLFFGLVYLALRLYPDLRRLFLKIFIAGAVVVVVFALLQITVLPPDILQYIGYGDTTIVPFLTVDQNMEYIRINSTLRGPNPLGAYAMIILMILVAYIVSRPAQFTAKLSRHLILLSGLFLGTILTLWVSYSRSALLATLIALGVFVFMTFGRKLSKWVWLGTTVGLLALVGGVFLARDTDFVSNIILHDNLSGGADVNSNEGHVESLQDGLSRFISQPFGGGVGSTGSASLYTDQPVIIENQYLLIAHEVGWLGLIIFAVITWLVMVRLWRRRQDWLASAVFASGIGLLVIGMLLPVWVDDTVAIIWWGLAAVALSTRLKKNLKS